LPHRDKGFLDSAIENNQLLDGLNDGFFLGIEMVLFLKQLPQFQNINGVLVSDLFDKITPLDMVLGEKFSFNPDDANSPIFIVAHGEIKLKNGDAIKAVLKPGDVHGDIFLKDGKAYDADHIEASERSVVFKIDLMDFYFVLANHHELVEGFIRNITEKPKANIA
jgi:CRP-like cAMP-binding protein